MDEQGAREELGGAGAPSCAYTLDHLNRVIDVDDAWLQYAQENRAPELTRERVVGRSVLGFVGGKATRRLYEALYRRVRAGAGPVEIPFRCDSPNRFRFMNLVLRAGRQGIIECEGVLIREQDRPYFSILDRYFPRSDERLPTCSLCKRIQAYGSRWLVLEEAIRELKLFGSLNAPHLEQTVCDECRASLVEPSHDGGGAA